MLLSLDPVSIFGTSVPCCHPYTSVPRTPHTPAPPRRLGTAEPSCLHTSPGQKEPGTAPGEPDVGHCFSQVLLAPGAGGPHPAAHTGEHRVLRGRTGCSRAALGAPGEDWVLRGSCPSPRRGSGLGAPTPRRGCGARTGGGTAQPGPGGAGGRARPAGVPPTSAGAAGRLPLLGRPRSRFQALEETQQVGQLHDAPAFEDGAQAVPQQRPGQAAPEAGEPGPRPRRRRPPAAAARARSARARSARRRRRHRHVPPRRPGQRQRRGQRPLAARRAAARPSARPGRSGAEPVPPAAAAGHSPRSPAGPRGSWAQSPPTAKRFWGRVLLFVTLLGAPGACHRVEGGRGLYSKPGGESHYPNATQMSPFLAMERSHRSPSPRCPALHQLQLPAPRRGGHTVRRPVESVNFGNIFLSGDHEFFPAVHALVVQQQGVGFAAEVRPNAVELLLESVQGVPGNQREEPGSSAAPPDRVG